MLAINVHAKSTLTQVHSRNSMGVRGVAKEQKYKRRPAKIHNVTLCIGPTTECTIVPSHAYVAEGIWQKNLPAQGCIALSFVGSAISVVTV